MKPQIQTPTNPLKYTDPTGYQRTSLGGASNWLGGGGGMGESGTGFSDNVDWNYFDDQNHYTNSEGVSVAFNDDPPVVLDQEAILDALSQGIQNNEVFAIRGETDIKNIYEEMVAGMNFRIINAFGRLTLVSAFGDFGKIMVDPSGGIWSTNLGGAHLADAVVKGSAGGGASKTLSTINTIAGVTSLSADAVSNTLTSTKVGSDIAYALSNGKIFLTSVKYFKPISYWAAGFNVGTDVILSLDGSQSWTETSINTAVTGIAFGVGGWPGLLIQLDYIGAKAYLRTAREHPEWILPYHSFLH